MKKILTIILAAVISTAATAQNSNAVSALRKFRADFVASMLSGDTTFVSYANPSLRLMPEFQMTIISRRNATRYYEAFHRRFDVTAFVRNESEVLDLDKRVVEWGLFNLSLIDRQTGKKYELPGKYMDLWMKDSSGKLSLVTQAWNYNISIDFADRLKFPDIPSVNVALGAHAPIEDPVSFELAGMNELMESVVSQHDARRWKMFYADDGNFMYSNNPVYQGRKALDEFLDEHVRGLVIFEKLDIRNNQIDDLGTYVIEYASHVAFVRGGDWSGMGTGKDLRIWRREKNGSLKIYRHIAMYD